MSGIPSSLMAAITMSAATGKNPWLPFGLLFAVAAPASVPEVLIDPQLHSRLHGLAAPEVLSGLAVLFIVLGTMESLADKIPMIERWLVPVSTTWRPFASVALSCLIAFATLADSPGSGPSSVQLVVGPTASASLAVLIVVAGSMAGLFATLGKTAARLLLSWIPVPGLRLMHSFADDLFTVGAVGAGLVFADSAVLAVVVISYFVLGVVLAPAAARLAAIHMRGTLAVVRETRRRLAVHEPGPAPAPPGPILRWLQNQGGGIDAAGVMHGWVLHAAGIGWCRRGYVIVSEQGVAFAQPRWFGLRVSRRAWNEVGRVGLAESVTGRTLVVEWEDGGVGQTIRVSLFAAPAEHIDLALRRGTESAQVAEVLPDSASARNRLVGFRLSSEGGRYRTPDELGDLRLQALLTLGAAGAVGLLTAGLVVPVGSGYLLSPFRRRFWVGLMLTAYLSACVIGSAFFGWPAAVVYAMVLNGVCLRDLARQHLRARVDGFVDVESFLPPVCARVWIASAFVHEPSDLREDAGRDGREMPEGFVDASWRHLVAARAGRQL